MRDSRKREARHGVGTEGEERSLVHRARFCLRLIAIPWSSSSGLSEAERRTAGSGGGSMGMSVVDSFSRGRRASMAVPTDRDRLSLMSALVMRRRLSDQVRPPGSAYGAVRFH